MNKTIDDTTYKPIEGAISASSDELIFELDTEGEFGLDPGMAERYMEDLADSVVEMCVERLQALGKPIYVTDTPEVVPASSNIRPITPKALYKGLMSNSPLELSLYDGPRAQ